MPKRRYFAGAWLGALWLGSPALAAEAAPDDSAPLHYIGSVELTPDKGAIGAGWTVVIKDSALTEIEFLLNADFGTALVSGPGVASMRSALDPASDDAARLYTINLVPAAEGAPRIVKFTYGGPLFARESPMVINTLDTDKVELTVDSFWFPFDARFETDLTAQVNVRIDGDWTAVGLGHVDPVRIGYHFVQSAPALDIALTLLSRSVVMEADGYIIHDARTEPGAKLVELSDALSGCTAYLNALAGPAGPLPHASVIITGRPEGAYSRGTLIALTDIENEDEESLRQFICHELAHYWSKANTSGVDNWINEGVADYLANMAIRDAMGGGVFDARMARYTEQLTGEDGPPIWTKAAIDRPSYLTLYRAAPMALRDLEAKMGEPAFAAFMQAVMAARIKTTPDLLALLEDLAGPETRNWFEARLGA